MEQQETSGGVPIKKAVDKKDPNAAEKQKKWEEFTKIHAERIQALPVVGGKRVVPCVWVEASKEWVWVSRQQKRQMQRLAMRDKSKRKKLAERAALQAAKGKSHDQD